MQSKYSFLDTLQILVVLILFGFKLIPQLQYSYTGLFWSLAYQGLFLIWMLLTILKSGLWIRYLSSYLKNWALWITFLFIGFLLFPNTQLGFFSLNLTFWEPMLIYFYYTQVVYANKTTSLISVICILFLLFGLFQSIQSVNANELAAREASSGHSSEDAVLTGNYSFTATLSIILPVAFLLLQSNIKKSWKIFSLVFVGASVFFILRCNLMISILCMLITIPLYWIFGERRKADKKRIFVVGLIFILFIFSFSFLKPALVFVIESLGKLIDSDEISQKIVQLTSLINGTMVGNVASRFDLDLIALRTFVSHPLLGIGPQNNAEIYFKTALGFHATLFDDIARYGILGMSIMLSVYIAFFKWLFTELDGTRSVKAIKASLFTYVIISMLNPTISANVGITIFFIVPSLATALYEYKETEK